jgi:hypothetical protein
MQCTNSRALPRLGGLSDGDELEPEPVVVVAVDGPRLATEGDFELPQPAATSATEVRAIAPSTRGLSMPVMEPAFSKAVLKRL